jgi:hypothetical protein
MMANKIIIIYPIDPTTDFLNQVVKSVQESFPENTYLIRPGLNFDLTFLPDEIAKMYTSKDLIIFLGHGNSSYLFGSTDKEGKKTRLLERNDIYRIFENKNLILFSCYSNELLRKPNQIREYIGFGNMPTDWNEIIAERDLVDLNYLKGLSENSLNGFKSFLVQMMCTALKKTFKNPNYMREIYLELRLELNKYLLRIPGLKSLSLEERTELFKLIQQTKREIFFK